MFLISNEIPLFKGTCFTQLMIKPTHFAMVTFEFIINAGKTQFQPCNSFFNRQAERCIFFGALVDVVQFVAY